MPSFSTCLQHRKINNPLVNTTSFFPTMRNPSNQRHAFPFSVRTLEREPKRINHYPTSQNQYIHTTRRFVFLKASVPRPTACAQWEVGQTICHSEIVALTAPYILTKSASQKLLATSTKCSLKPSASSQSVLGYEYYHHDVDRPTRARMRVREKW